MKTSTAISALLIVLVCSFSVALYPLFYEWGLAWARLSGVWGVTGAVIQEMFLSMAVLTGLVTAWWAAARVVWR